MTVRSSARSGLQTIYKPKALKRRFLLGKRSLIMGMSQLGGFEFNAATGGTESTITNYNGTGQTWKVHSFSSGAVLTVTKSGSPFKVFVLGGGPGGCGIYSGNGGQSGGGQYYYSDTETLRVGSYGAVIGGGGGGFCCEGAAADDGNGTNGGSTTFAGRTGAGGVHHTFNSSIHPFVSNITGTSLSYSSNTAGANGYAAAPTTPGSAGRTSGIHPTGGPNFPSTGGITGIVVVAYQIG